MCGHLIGRVCVYMCTVCVCVGVCGKESVCICVYDSFHNILSLVIKTSHISVPFTGPLRSIFTVLLRL